MLFASTLLCAAAAISGVQATPISTSEVQDKANQGLRLLKFAQDTEPEWKTKEEKLELIRAGTNFMDVTKTYNPDRQLVKATKVAPSYDAPSHQDEVNPILDTVQIENMQNYLSTLTEFNNRYYESDTGREASDWITQTVQGIIDDTSINANVSQFEHDFVESSIIARIAGTTDGPVTILGGHMDSINLRSPDSGRAPGADDDGSGSVNLLEAFRALAEAGFAPSTPVEFQWYAGEEGGLLGSADIAAQYNDDGIEVNAMMQLDMTAYFEPGTEEVIALMPDFVSDELNDFVKSLIEEYLTIGWEMSSECGYACSDHASWNEYGYPTTLPFETRFGEDNAAIHTDGDTTDVDGFSWDHSLQYAKLAVAFAYELAI